MPRMDAAIYAAHLDNVLKLAKRKGGVSRPQIINALNVTRAVAGGLIEKAGLVKIEGTKGRTEYFKANGVTEPEPAVVEVEPVATPEAVKAVAVPENSDVPAADPDAVIAALDAEILKTRDLLRIEAAKAGKALGEWSVHLAGVDSLRAQMAELVAKRLAASS